MYQDHEWWNYARADNKTAQALRYKARERGRQDMIKAGDAFKQPDIKPDTSTIPKPIQLPLVLLPRM